MPKFGTDKSKCSRRRHGHRRQVGRAVAAGCRTHDSQVCETGDAAQMGDAAGMHDGGADMVDELFLDQLLAVPDRD